MLHLLYNCLYILSWGSRKVSNIEKSHTTLLISMFLWWTGKELSQLFYCFCGEASDMCRAMNVVIICWRWQAERTFCLITVNSSFQTKCVAHLWSWQKGGPQLQPMGEFPSCSLAAWPILSSNREINPETNQFAKTKENPCMGCVWRHRKKWWEGSYCNPKKAELCTCVCLQRDWSQGRKRSWSCILFHSQF